MKVRNINIVNTKEKIIEPLKKIRVCGYVRVSTDAALQINSLENQVDYYKNKLQKNPDYEFCGVFKDAGISGNRENRPGFQEMIKKANENQIDLIITKSISRFARNTVLLL